MAITMVDDMPEKEWHRKTIDRIDSITHVVIEYGPIIINLRKYN